MHKLRSTAVEAIVSINKLKWISQYTTAAAPCCKPASFMAEYLVTSLGFSAEQALITSSKVSYFKSTQNPISVVNFFQTRGFDQTQIKKIVSCDPRILSYNVDRVLKPKINALLDIGLCEADVAHVLSSGPDFCNRSLNDHIIPVLGHWKSVFGDYGTVANAVKKSSWLLGHGALKHLPVVVSLLKSYGLSNDQIRAFALKRPRYLVLDAKMLQSVVVRVEERLGIPRGSPVFVRGIHALSSLSEQSLEVRMGIYKSFGFTDADVQTLGRRNPAALMISESKLKKGLEFFLNVVGYQPAVLVSMPHLLTFSLEKRVIPRYIIWKEVNEKGLRKSTSLAYSLTLSEPDFFKKYVLPFKDQICNDYVKRSQSTLKDAK